MMSCYGSGSRAGAGSEVSGLLQPIVQMGQNVVRTWAHARRGGAKEMGIVAGRLAALALVALLAGGCAYMRFQAARPQSG